MKNEMLLNEEAVSAVLDSINEIPEDSDVHYEVWALGYDEYDYVTAAELLLGTFEDPDEATKYADAITCLEIRKLDKEELFTKHADMISVEVETVVDMEDEGTMNVGTVFKKSLAVCVADISISQKDYEVLENGDLKISCNLLKNFNKNDIVKILFEESSDKPILVHKIISKVIYEDGEYYHLEFVY